MKKRILLISCLSFTLVTAGISVNVFSENETTVSAIERVIPWYEEYAEETSVSDVLDGLGESYMLIPSARLNPETQNIYPASNTSLVITETDLKQITELSYKYKVYSASTLQLDQINQELEKYSVELSRSKDDKNIYETSEIHDLTLKKEIAEILSKFEHVNRIDETSEVSLISEGFVAYVYTKSDLEKDQIIEKYSKYGLEIKNIKENDDGNKKYIYYFKFSQFIGTGISDVEYQKRLNELLDDRDIKINFAFYAETSDSNLYSKTIYQACSSDKNFDINDDGKSDVTDLSMLSLYLIGDLTLNDNQLITADIDSDGTVTLADLARLRQYLSKKIDSLTDDKDADTVVQEKEVKYSAAISVRVTDNKLDEYPQHSIIEDRAGFEALYNEKQSLEIEKTGFYSGGIFPILNDKYTDEWFETHKLYVAYPGKGGPTGYRYKVESVTNKAVTIHWDQLGESQSRTENKADWIIFIEVSKDADVTDATEIKFNTVF